MLGESEIANRFRPHYGETATEKLTQSEVHSEFSLQFENFANELDRRLPEGRAKSIALTHLEDALVWTNKAYASQFPVAKRN